MAFIACLIKLKNKLNHDSNQLVATHYNQLIDEGESIMSNKTVPVANALTENVQSLCHDLTAFYQQADDLAYAFEAAEILAQMAMRPAVIRAGFAARLRRLPEGLSEDLLKTLRAEEQALLVDLEKIDLIDALHQNRGQNIERLRQMLLAMANDVRVVVIKLALQLVAMRHLTAYDAEKRKQLALQTRDIHAPLANRLGIAKLKWELEDLALRELEPTTYRLIASSLAEERRVRVHYVDEVVNTIKQALKDEGVLHANVYGRAKHINSIFNKMKKKNKKLEDIYDLLAIRIQVESLKECYTALGIVHAMWKHIPSEFDDYIANPKPNGYQSLHTAVVGPLGKTVEIQIRTHEMHDYAELGVAAHWRYKENSTGKISAYERQINWLRALLAEDDEMLAEEFSAEIAEERVYAITPQGQVIELPAGATPLDFAYYIHTDLGHRCKGARVNGQLVPITHILKTGDNVEILTHKKAQPSRDWLNPHAGYLKSSKARGKVRHFFRQLEREHAIEEGKALFEKALSEHHLEPNNKEREKMLNRFNVKTHDDLYAALGFGDLGIKSVCHYLEDILDENRIALSNIAARLARLPIKKPQRKKQAVLIEGIDDLLISMAPCCNPVPPEEITGFISTTKGVRIHQSQCKNLAHLREAEPDKILPVRWAVEQQYVSAQIDIRGIDRVGIMREIAQALQNEGISIAKAQFGRDEDEHFVMHLLISIRDTAQMERGLARIKLIKNVQSALRVETLSP